MELSAKLSFLESFLGKSKYNSAKKEATFYCVFCKHHKQKLSINIETDVFQCWVCSKKGRTLVPIIKHCGTSQNLKEYFEFYKAASVKLSEVPEHLSFRLELPKGFEPLFQSKLPFAKIALSYVKERGLSEDDVLRFKLGITEEEQRYVDRLILPSFDKSGNLNFYTGRLLKSSDYKYKYISAEIPKGHITKIILNELNLNFKNPLTVVEGFFDMTKANDNCVYINGSHLSKESKLFETIVENQTPVMLALDPDAQSKSNSLAKEFMEYGIEVYNIDVLPFKDVGDMSREEFKVRYENAKHLNKNDLLLNKIRALNVKNSSYLRHPY